MLFLGLSKAFNCGSLTYLKELRLKKPGDNLAQCTLREASKKGVMQQTVVAVKDSMLGYEWRQMLCARIRASTRQHQLFERWSLLALRLPVMSWDCPLVCSLAMARKPTCLIGIQGRFVERSWGSQLRGSQASLQRGWTGPSRVSLAHRGGGVVDMPAY